MNNRIFWGSVLLSPCITLAAHAQTQAPSPPPQPYASPAPATAAPAAAPAALTPATVAPAAAPAAQPYGTYPGATPAAYPGAAPAAYPAAAPAAYPAAAPTGQPGAAPMAGPTAQSQPGDAGVSEPAFVRDPGATGQAMLSAFGMLGYGYGFATGYGVGARFQLVLAKDLIKHQKIHDEIALEPGIDFLTASYDYGFADIEYTYREITPVVGVSWLFWLNNRVAIYPKIDLGYHITSWSVKSGGEELDIGHSDVSALYFQGAGGVIFRLAPSVALRAEGGWRALRVGAGFSI